ncbi:putative ADP-ribose pyrophosphatase [Lepidopterella palustris CBS 459.81]|uniref:Putative ADP-ribose pyrophosphatase n=1 Tax=Lepidopterella palustris CBS 459.81 TaxID=1314670 RepID=A0A8E2EFH8_9PEZI|nr:putative ADP-ribose pyrophosphatase [Lepidopterella palustris CBS 459.81]
MAPKCRPRYEVSKQPSSPDTVQDYKDARWATLVKTTYIDPDSTTRTWESAERLTRPAGSLIDGVGIVAILQHPSDPSAPPSILLQKQFRPPIDAVTIEVPAGLIDAGETAEQCALRELKEETGYVGTVVGEGFGVSPVMFNDPGFCNTNLHMVHVTVDLSKPENQNPKPELEDNEFIECFSVPLTDLYAACRRFEKEGFAIDARVGTFAEGIEVAKRWKLV